MASTSRAVVAGDARWTSVRLEAEMKERAAPLAKRLLAEAAQLRSLNARLAKETHRLRRALRHLQAGQEGPLLVHLPSCPNAHLPPRRPCPHGAEEQTKKGELVEESWETSEMTAPLPSLAPPADTWAEESEVEKAGRKLSAARDAWEALSGKETSRRPELRAQMDELVGAAGRLRDVLAAQSPVLVVRWEQRWGQARAASRALSQMSGEAKVRALGPAGEAETEVVVQTLEVQRAEMECLGLRRETSLSQLRCLEALRKSRDAEVEREGTVAALEARVAEAKAEVESLDRKIRLNAERQCGGCAELGGALGLLEARLAEERAGLRLLAHRAHKDLEQGWDAVRHLFANPHLLRKAFPPPDATHSPI